MLKKIASIVFCFFAYAVLSPSLVHADANFSVSLNSTYTIGNTGDAFIQQKFTLTNKNPTIFAKQYDLEIGATKLKNIRVTDGKNDIPSTITTTNNRTNIHIAFSDNVVGEGKSRTFSIEFENPDAAVVSGNILEIYVPKLTNVSDYDHYSVTMIIPQSFGDPARVSPNQYTIDKKNGFTVLTFNNIGNESISALFGEKQIFDYTLRYNLENTTGSTGIIQVALPPDTERQRMQYVSLDPEPKEMTRDNDGNWIATYEIAAEKNLDVYLTGKAFIYLNDQTSFPFSPPTQALLQPQKFWESDDARIKALAQKYKTPKEIFDFVVSTLSYNYNKVGENIDRLGAVGALNAPTNAICQEFTDLFIAIARADGIPARRATGFAYTANSRLRPLSFVEDVLHAWPEYYDAEKKTWIPVDPTWTNTTGGVDYFNQFDFNHFVFAINGESSTIPYAAGSYKRVNENTKDVDVRFGQDEPAPAPSFTVQLQHQTLFPVPFHEKYTVTVINNTGVARYNIPVQITTESNDVQIESAPGTIDYLLPFQKREFPVIVKTKSWLIPHSFGLTVELQGLSSSHDLETGINIKEISGRPFISIILGGGMVVGALFAGSLLVSRRRR